MKPNTVGYIATACSIGGVAMQSLLPRYIPVSFVVFLAANMLWLSNGILTRNRPLMALQAITAALNVHALLHWFV